MVESHHPPASKDADLKIKGAEVQIRTRQTQELMVLQRTTQGLPSLKAALILPAGPESVPPTVA